MKLICPLRLKNAGCPKQHKRLQVKLETNENPLKFLRVPMNVYIKQADGIVLAMPNIQENLQPNTLPSPNDGFEVMSESKTRSVYTDLIPLLDVGLEPEPTESIAASLPSKSYL